MSNYGKQAGASAKAEVMKRLQAALCLFMAFLLATCMVPFAAPAAADPSGTTLTTGSTPELSTADNSSTFNVTFPSATNSVSDLQVALNYSDDLFAGKSGTYNDALGYASMCLAAAAGNSSAETSYANKDKNIRAFLKGVGCDESTILTNEGYSHVPMENSNIGVAIGTKNVMVNESGSDKAYKLFVIGVRGISYEAEWGSNLLIGNGGDHQGFAEARDSVLGVILPYIRDHTNSGDNVKIWIAGYSRGGAVANLASGWLGSWLQNETAIQGETPVVQYAQTYDPQLKRNTESARYNLAGRNLSMGDVYCYTVNAPQGADTAKVTENNQYCAGVHNLINPDDWISQMGMSWWGFSRYGTDHDLSSANRAGGIDRDTPMLPSKSEAVTAMMDRLKKINSNAAYSAPWFKQYYFSLWNMGIVEDTGGAGNSYLPKAELVGKQGRYFEEFTRFSTGALNANDRSTFVAEYQEAISYLAELFMGLSVNKQAKLGTAFKTHLTTALREKLGKPGLSLDNLGSDAFFIMNLVLNDEAGFTSVCKNTLTGVLAELNAAHDKARIGSTAATLAKMIRLIVKTDGQNFYHLITLAKNTDGISQAHYPEVALAWWTQSGADPVDPPQPPASKKLTVRFFDNKDGSYSPTGQPLFTQELSEGEIMYFSNGAQPTIDGQPVDDGVVYYNAPTLEGYEFLGWETAPRAGENSFPEYYGPEDCLYYGDFEQEDVQAGTCNLYAMWDFEGDDIDSIIARMSMDEKVSQMIVPAFRSWDGTNVTNLDAAPALKTALQAHQYCGAILYAENVQDSEQVTRLTSALQSNNAAISGASTNIPYLLAVDEEGGLVTRLRTGTRMNGSMAIGATGDQATENARETGEIIGEEVAAAGFNVNFAPTIDVNSNPANPIIGTRSYSDDPTTAAKLGLAFVKGLAENKVIASYKHFPGHGDTVADTHIDTASVDKTYDQLKQTELVPFQNAIDEGADLIMTAHITLPKVDEEVTFADGTKGYYPATMSEHVLTDILRGDMGYQGVVVTDALEMKALHSVPLVAGTPGTAEYEANIAEVSIRAGANILLLPKDLNNADAATLYDDYINTLCQRANGDIELMASINDSVARILELKEAYGILDADTSSAGVDGRVATAQEVIGSDAHHDVEAAIAQKAITLLKNDEHALPISGHKGNVVVLAVDSDELKPIEYAVKELQNTGIIDADARIVNQVTGTATGSEDSPMKVTISHYRVYGTPSTVHYPDELQQAVTQADSVIAFSITSGIGSLQPTAAEYQALSRIIADAHEAGASFTLLSSNLPYDSARYQGSDAIVCAYMSAGVGIDPAERASTGNKLAYNANVIAALEMMFDAFSPSGTLPVTVPKATEADDGTMGYSSQALYERGDGLQSLDYAFVEGAGGMHELGAASGLHFKANARHDKLVGLYSDGALLDASSYTMTAGSTEIELSADYLNGLDAGEHSLEAVYDYGSGAFPVSTTYSVTKAGSDTPASNTSSTTAGSPKTGDALPLVAIAIILLIILAAIALALIARKKRKQ